VLNENYNVAQVLDRERITFQEWHRHFKVLPNVTQKSPAFKIFVGDKKISSVSFLSSEQTKSLRKWEISNGYSFPCFNQGPVIPESRMNFEKAFREKYLPTKQNFKENEKFSQILRIYPLSWAFIEDRRNAASRALKDRISEKLQTCLGKLPQELKDVLGKIPDEHHSLHLLFQRLAEMTPDTYLETLCKAIYERLRGNPGDWEKLAPLLLFGKQIKDNVDSVPGVSVVLDVEDYGDTYPVAHEKTHLWINEQLLKRDMKKEKTQSDPQGKDAFGGSLTDWKDKMPQVKLPQIAGVALRSMTKDSPCQYRYGTVESSSFPIGSENRQKIKGALEWISREEFKGYTWNSMGKNSLLFAYPMDLPGSNSLPIANSITGRGRETLAIETFKNLSRQVVETLKGCSKPLSNIEIKVFVLQKMDKARTQAVYNLIFSAERFMKAAEEWENGCLNIPKLHILEQGKKVSEKNSKKRTFLLTPQIPLPTQIADGGNVVWKKDGSGFSEIKIFKPYFGIDLMIKQLDPDFISYFLRQVLQSSEGFLVSLAQAIHRGEGLFGKGLTYYKGLLPSLIGLLLYKLGHLKEDYMKTQPYYVGNLLAISDALHFLYCKHVRTSEEGRAKNQIQAPPQLLGNALVTAALESPERAVSVLAERIPPYVTWAKTCHGQDAGLAKYFLQQFAQVSHAMTDSEKSLPSELDDAGRAMLLLGYLAGASRKTEKDTEEEMNMTGGSN